MRIVYQRRPLAVSCSNVQRSDQFKRNQNFAAKQPHNQKLVISSRRALLATPPLLWCGCGFCRQATAAATNATSSPTTGGPSRNAFLDRVFAENMYNGMHEYEKAIAPVKRNLFSRLKPAGVSSSAAPSSLEVVEIGCGTGPNLKYYNRDEYADLTITAVDPNDFMLPYLYKNMDAGGWARESIAWKAGRAEALPLEESSTDVVVCTLVLCSVDDVEKTVKEAKRVLRPGGSFLFIEHTVAQPSASFLFKISQQVLNPLQRLLADGCNLTRDPLPVIEEAGFTSVEAMRFEVDGMGLIAPHVAGIATV